MKILNVILWATFFGIFNFYNVCSASEVRIPQYQKGDTYKLLPESNGNFYLNRIDYYSGTPYYARVNRPPTDHIEIKETRAELIRRVYNKYGRPIAVDIVGVPVLGLLHEGLYWGCKKLRGDENKEKSLKEYRDNLVDMGVHSETIFGVPSEKSNFTKYSTLVASWCGEKMKSGLRTLALGICIKDLYSLYAMACELYNDERETKFVPRLSQQNLPLQQEGK